MAIIVEICFLGYLPPFRYQGKNKIPKIQSFFPYKASEACNL